MADDPDTVQKCFVRGMDFSGHCDFPELWCAGCPRDLSAPAPEPVDTSGD